VAIAQLVEQGALSFDDPVGQLGPGFPPEAADAVTVHHLLTHTSGMGDAAIGPDRGPEPPLTLAAQLERIVAEPRQFPPGTRFAYSDDGFITLGAVIERVTGRSSVPGTPRECGSIPNAVRASACRPPKGARPSRPTPLMPCAGEVLA
jgi:CubicO group peptidase (beta-lactamase class C family)